MLPEPLWLNAIKGLAHPWRHRMELLKDVVVLGRVLPMSSNKIYQNQEVYYWGGIMGTLKATHYKDPPKVLVNGKIIDK